MELMNEPQNLIAQIRLKGVAAGSGAITIKCHPRISVPHKIINRHSNGSLVKGFGHIMRSLFPVARDPHNGQFLFCDAVIQPHLKLRHREGNKTAFCAAAQSVQWLVG